MTLNWLCNFITICAGASIGTLLANITINRNELKLKRILGQLEEIKNEKQRDKNKEIRDKNKEIKTSLKSLLEDISLHYKWLYSKQGGKRFKSEYHNHWISIKDYCYILSTIKNQYDEYFLKKSGFDYSIDNVLKEIKLAIPQMKDPFGKINEDNKYDSLKNEKIRYKEPIYCIEREMQND